MMLEKSREKRVEAFTLIELLVVIAIIVILAGLLLPTLASARGRGQAISCLSQQKQISLACLMYADESNDRLPYNLGQAEIRRLEQEKRYLNWTTPVMNWELDPDNTNHVLLTEGGIGPYTSRSAALYRCPTDHVVSDIQLAAGWSSRVRSVSMNAMVGNAGEFSAGGTNVNNPHYVQFFKLSDIPRPAGIFVFIEEHPDSINDAYFLNRFYSKQWTDLPASYHNGSANLTFADGHTELHKWQFASTKPPSRPDAAQLPFEVPAAERGDFAWLMQRTSLDND